MTRKDGWENSLARYLDGGATPREIEALERAARRDAGVRRAIDQGEALIAALEQLPVIEPPRDLVAAAERELIVRGSTRGWRPWLLVPAALAVGLAAAVIGWPWAGESTPQEKAWPAPRWMVATAVSGEVWVESAGARRAAFVGDVFQANSRIETAAGAEVSLALGRGVEVNVKEESRIGVIAVDPEFAALIIEHGLLAASADGRSPLEIRLRGALHTIRLELGVARVLHAQNGTTTLACAQGVVNVGKSRVRAGFLLDLRPDHLGEPRPIPTRLELAMDPVAPVPEGALAVSLSGRTDIGAELRINGEQVAVGPDGHFSHAFSLATGSRQIIATARDVIGRRQELHLALQSAQKRSPAPPAVPIEVDWEWADPTSEPG